MSVTFEQPWWLLVAALALPAAVMGLSWLGTMSRLRAWSAIVLRTALLGLIASILAGASAVRETDRMAVIAVVDMSESVRQFAEIEGDNSAGGRTREALRRWILNAARDPQRRPDDLLGVVVFDGEAMAAATPRPLGPLDAPTDGVNAISGGASDFSLDWKIAEGTNIEKALRLASAMFPPDAARRIVLISDGAETEGDAASAAQELAGGAGRGLRIDALPLSYRVRNEVLVEAVDAPPQAATGSTVAVRVALLATEAASGTIELLYEDRPVDLNGERTPGTGMRVELRAGRNLIELPIKLDDARTVHRMRPVFIPANNAMDRIASNNSAEAFSVTPGKGRVLIVDGVDDAPGAVNERPLVKALRGADIDVVSVLPQEAPIDVLSLQAYDLVILENVAAEELPRGGHKALADYVSELGGGLVMVGGPDSFGAGGWKGTDLEPILPVRLDLPEQLLAPSAAVSLVIDNSGSMGHRVMGGLRSQQEVANEGAALAIETLDKSDYVGVIAFNSGYSEVVPMAQNSEAKLSAARVRAIGTGGGTNLYPALDRAGQTLLTGAASKASVRHVIILSDGQSEGDASEGIAIARDLRSKGITVSSIAVGDGADIKTLAAIAYEGGGQFYEVIDPNTLPRVFIREIRVVRKPLIRETPFRPVDLRSGSRLMGSLGGLLGSMPNLRGLVLTQKREDPKVNYAMATPEGEPLLAHWFAGRGQVAAFTSDAHRWAQGWLAWPGYAALWTQIARTIARPASERSSELTTEIIDGQLVIRLDATDDEGKPIDLLNVPGTVFAPDGTSSALQLAQTGPGVYEARSLAHQRGNYVVALTPRKGEVAMPTVVGGASRALGEEFRTLQSNVGLLRRIAEETGGRVLSLDLPEESGLYSREGVEPVRAASPIWRILLVWAVVVFLLDVATRRVAWDRLLSSEVVAAMREQALAAAVARSEKAAAMVAALRTASEGPTPPATASTGTDSRADAEGGSIKERARRRFVRRGEEAHEKVEPLKPVTMDEDAQAERRERLRAQMLERLNRQRSEQSGGDKKAADADGEKKDDGSGEKADGESSASGLREAKRRARERFQKPPSSE